MIPLSTKTAVYSIYIFDYIVTELLLILVIAVITNSTASPNIVFDVLIGVLLSVSL